MIAEKKLDLLETSKAERVMFQLFSHAVFLKKENSEDLLKTTASLGNYDEVSAEWNSEIEDSDITKEAMKQLKKEGFIKSYSEIFRGEEDPEDYETAYAEIEFYPNKITSQLEKIWKPKRREAEVFADLYLKLIEFISKYFKLQRNIKEDEKVDATYRAFISNIKEQFKKLDLSRSDELSNIFQDCKLPFKSIMSADIEMKKNKIDIDFILAGMQSYYGKLKRVVQSFDTRNYKKGNVENSLEKFIKKGSGEKKLPDQYKVSICDREVWVNDKYLISRPHGAGSNLEFLIYLRDNPNKVIKRSEMPEWVKEVIRNKKFSKILNALGFKSEILKLFFPIRGKGSIKFTPKVSIKEAENRTKKKDLLLMELETAHIKNSTE